MYRNDAVVVIDWKIVLNFGLEKKGVFNKIPFPHKVFYGDFWKGSTSFSSTNIILDG